MRAVIPERVPLPLLKNPGGRHPTDRRIRSCQDRSGEATARPESEKMRTARAFIRCLLWVYARNSTSASVRAGVNVAFMDSLDESRPLGLRFPFSSRLSRQSEAHSSLLHKLAVSQTTVVWLSPDSGHGTRLNLCQAESISLQALRQLKTGLADGAVAARPGCSYRRGVRGLPPHRGP